MTSTSFMILTGGKSTRFGSNKSEILFAGTSLLVRLLEKLPPGEVIVVGPQFNQTIRPVAFAQEHPIGTGPVAAIGAGITLVESEFLLVLATDLPFISELVPELLRNLPAMEDALIPVDEDGKLQTLCGVYRTEALKAALREIGSLANESMKNLTKRLNIQKFPISYKDATKLIDIDTPKDLIRAIEIHEREMRDK